MSRTGDVICFVQGCCEIQFCLIVLLKKDYCARPRPEKAIHPQHAGLTQSLCVQRLHALKQEN